MNEEVIKEEVLKVVGSPEIIEKNPGLFLFRGPMKCVLDNLTENLSVMSETIKEQKIQINILQEKIMDLEKRISLLEKK